MPPRRPGNAEASLTPLILSVFRLSGTLVAAGDRMVEDLGLTSAKWQLLGAIAEAPVPLTLAALARRRGISRQGIRITARSLVATGHLRSVDNPDHRSAQLAELTTEGERAFQAAQARQAPWVQHLGAGFTDARIQEAIDLLETVRERLQQYEQMPCTGKEPQTSTKVDRNRRGKA